MKYIISVSATGFFLMGRFLKLSTLLVPFLYYDLYRSKIIKVRPLAVIIHSQALLTWGSEPITALGFTLFDGLV